MPTVSATIRIMDQATRTFQRMTNSVLETTHRMERLKRVMEAPLKIRNRESVEQSKQLEASLQRIAALEQKISTLQSQINVQMRDTGSYSRSWWDQLQNVASAYYLIQGVLQGINGMADTADTYINTQARLDLINDKLQTTAELQDKIFASAERARGSYTDMAAVIGRMGTLAEDAFKSNDELIAFTELMQKSFRVGGSSTMEQQAGMYQLSQAMAAGKLQGDEFRSIMENAPMLANAIAKFTGRTKGELKEMSADGTITADIIKGAMFAAADDINQKFATMPRTFGDVMTELQNSALQSFAPLIERINGMLNSESGAVFIEQLKLDIQSAVEAINNLLTAAINVYKFISSNWGLIAPIVWGIVGAFVAWKGITTVMNTLLAINAIRQAVMGAATMLATRATTAATAAQWGLNAALLANPITWIILAVIALIAIFYLAVAAINKFAGTSLSATGIIVGAFAHMGAVIWNVVVGTINALIQFLWAYFVEPWISIVEWVLNVFNGGFNSFGDAVKNLLGQIISWFLSLGKVVTNIIDAIFGTDWTAGLSSLQDSVLAWGKNEQAITLSREAPRIDSRIDYGGAWDAGYNWGANLFGGDDSSAAELAAAKAAADASFTQVPPGSATTIDKVGEVGEVGKIKNTVDISNEDLKIMRELAEMQAIQNFVTLTPTVQVTTGPVSKETDINTIVARIESTLTEQIASSAKGVYANG